MGIFNKKLGIDLGTANTLVFFPGKGIVLNEPSVVAVSEQDNKILAIGIEAKQMIGKTPGSIITYCPMKDGVIADYRVTEAMLRYFINKAMGKWNLFKPDVMVSVPAGVTSTERRAVVEAALKAGAKNAYVVKEPILAAIGAGIPIHEPRGHMIADIGGGTIDVAVISLGGIVASNSVKCAGNRIDESIIDYVKKTRNLAIGEKTAEEVKITIIDPERLHQVPQDKAYSRNYRRYRKTYYYGQSGGTNLTEAQRRFLERGIKVKCWRLVLSHFDFSMDEYIPIFSKDRQKSREHKDKGHKGRGNISAQR